MTNFQRDTIEEYPDFCTELRLRTKAIHDKSDKLINFKLAAVLTDTQLWGSALADFYIVFEAIEEALHEKCDHEPVGPLLHSDMLRTEAFKKDLLFYLGEGWEKKVVNSQAAKDYVDRIYQVSTENPTLLVAYAHSMYLALLAGGQIIRRIVKKTLGLSGEDGLAIFDFETASRKEMKQRFMNSVNNLKLSRSQKEEIVKEKCIVFSMNNAIANSIKPNWQSYTRLIKFIIISIIIVLLILYLTYFFVKLLL